VLTVHIDAGLFAAVEPGQLGRLGCDRAHRLGPILSLRSGAGHLADPALHLSTAHFALPNLRFPDVGKRLAGGRNHDPSLARLIARAEAAERFAGGDPAPHDLVRATEGELRAPPLPVDQLVRLNARQRGSRTDVVAYDPAVPHTWIEGTERDGARRSVLASAVFYPFTDPHRGDTVCHANSSGTAAHADIPEARRRALSELIERDAFMWTWVQRVSREQVERASVGAELRGRMDALESAGLSVALVNLTLDTLPVLLCVLHAQTTLSMGMSCARDPRIAAGRSFDEAVGLLPSCRPRAEGRLQASEVSSPEDHAQWHQHADQIERDSFLFGSPDRVALDDIRAPDASEDELVASIGQPVTVDLTSPATYPFSVVRVLVPGMIPISFGHDREPLGMRRLWEPKTTHAGNRVGRSLDLERAGPIELHPFA
jgi:ribosomal protein S12 methylthiotransferase accessory factor